MKHLSPTIHSASCRCPRCRHQNKPGPVVIRRRPHPLRWRPDPSLWVVLFMLAFWSGVGAIVWRAFS